MILLDKSQISTMLDEHRIKNIHYCVQEIYNNNIEGDIVECGVWRGGNIIVCKKAFDSVNVTKTYYCFDTFQGMTEPDEIDGEKAINRWHKENIVCDDDGNFLYTEWCRSELDEVKNEFSKHEVLDDRIKFIVGDVHQTLEVEDNIPEKIALLRLDTDWYSSTKIELEKLYNRVVSGGFVIIDDYDLWPGQKKAVDEFFGSEFLNNHLLKKNPDGQSIYPTAFFRKV